MWVEKNNPSNKRIKRKRRSLRKVMENKSSSKRIKKKRTSLRKPMGVEVNKSKKRVKTEKIVDTTFWLMHEPIYVEIMRPILCAASVWYT